MFREERGAFGGHGRKFIAARIDQRLLANGLEQDLRRAASLNGEKALVEDADLMRRYQDTLAGWVRQETGRDPGDHGYRDGGSTEEDGSGRLLREPTPGPVLLDVR